MGLGEGCIDSVNVDGYFTVSEYVNMAGLDLKGRILQGAEEGHDESAAQPSSSSSSSYFGSVVDFFANFVGISVQSARRRASSHAYLEINVNLLTSERYVTAWEEQKLVLTNRLKMNID